MHPDYYNRRLHRQLEIREHLFKALLQGLFPGAMFAESKHRPLQLLITDGKIIMWWSVSIVGIADRPGVDVDVIGGGSVKSQIRGP